MNTEALTPVSAGALAPSPSTSAPVATRRPRTRLRETETAVVLTLELPGVDEEGLDLVREGHTLRVVGRRGAPAGPTGRVHFDEIQSGDFEHRFRVSPKLDLESIEARLAHGVLEITLPRVRPEATRIPIRMGS